MDFGLDRVQSSLALRWRRLLIRNRQSGTLWVNPKWCSMQIQSARTFIYVSDVARSAAFYADRLGLRESDRIIGGTIMLGRGFELELLQAPPDAAPPGDQRVGLLFFVADVDAAYEELLQQQVTILSAPETSTDGTRAFYLADPDGLPIGLLQEAVPEPPPEWIFEDQ